jgi:hypothetical protein
MKIQLTKFQKIELLKAAQSGTLDTGKIPDLMKEIKDLNPFIDLMIEATNENTTD